MTFPTVESDCMREAQSTRLRVLVVDDCADNADSMVSLLHLWGHEAAAAYDSQTGLAMAAAYDPDIVFFDIAMPPFDGYQLARSLQACSEALLVAVSGFADLEHRERALDAGIDHYFAKPVDLSRLEELLTQRQREKSSIDDEPLQPECQRRAAPVGRSDFVI